MEKKGLNVTFFQNPNGERKNIFMQNIEQPEIEFFINHSLNVSMEELMHGNVVLYSSLIGNCDAENEAIYLVPTGESCQDAMRKLRHQVETLSKM